MREVTGVVAGRVAAGFEGVAEAFQANFDELGEVGAAFAAYRDGEVVVDLWGGIADTDQATSWSSDTAGLIFSGSKALVAVCLWLLIDCGALDPDAPVARYWPEFGAAGKSMVTVAEVASHRARMPAVRTPLSERDVLDPVYVASVLAGQAQEEDPRARFVYHPLTYGWLCAELVRRIDGRMIGDFFAAEVAGPLGLDLWIGIDPSVEPRVARLEYAPGYGENLILDPADDLQAAVLGNPDAFPASDLPWNRPAWRQAQIPAGNGIGTARSIARLFGCLACGGQIDGVRLLQESTLVLATRQLVAADDPFLPYPLVFGIGMALQTRLKVFGPPSTAFGHTGAGGSVHGAWPGRRVGFSYVMNQMRDSQLVDPRPGRLLQALYDAVDRT